VNIHQFGLSVVRVAVLRIVKARYGRILGCADGPLAALVPPSLVRSARRSSPAGAFICPAIIGGGLGLKLRPLPCHAFLPAVQGQALSDLASLILVACRGSALFFGIRSLALP